MATVAELVQLICDDAALDDSSGSDERLLALRRLNQAGRRICATYNTYRRDVSITVTDEDVDLSSAIGTNVLGIDWLGIVDSADADKIVSLLTRTTDRDLSDKRTTSPGNPSWYSYDSPYILRLDRVDTAGVYLGGRYYSTAATLAESGSDTVLASMLHPAWHEELLAKWAVCLVLEGWQGEEERASYHRRELRDTISDFNMWRVKQGGTDMPSSPYETTRFDTSSIIITR